VLPLQASELTDRRDGVPLTNPADDVVLAIYHLNAEQGGMSSVGQPAGRHPAPTAADKHKLMAAMAGPRRR
jgi:hypothetical protein